MIKDAGLSADMLSDRDGVVAAIDNVTLVSIARVLGNPKVKAAGIRVHKMPGESVKKGEPLITIYAQTENRLENGKRMFNVDKLYRFK